MFHFYCMFFTLTFCFFPSDIIYSMHTTRHPHPPRTRQYHRNSWQHIPPGDNGKKHFNQETTNLCGGSGLLRGGIRTFAESYRTSPGHFLGPTGAPTEKETGLCKALERTLVDHLKTKWGRDLKVSSVNTSMFNNRFNILIVINNEDKELLRDTTIKRLLFDSCQIVIVRFLETCDQSGDIYKAKLQII